MTHPGTRHARCGGTWRGPVHDEAGAWLVCTSCGEETAAAQPLENGAPPMNPCTTCGRLRWGPGHVMADCIDQAHAEALAENTAHDEAMTKAQELTPQMLARFSDVPAMPRGLRSQLAARRHFSLTPPRRHA